jgi:anti-sigma regulatory factor (Ser/Thr protein kinase)
MGMTQATMEGSIGGYSHEAFLYSDLAEFVAGATSFISRAVDAGDPILVIVSAPKIETLRRALGATAQRVDFADMAQVGNPARIIAAWQAFVQAHAGAAQLWGIGEPIYPERSPAELAECQLHEALLNVAFDAATPFTLLCPYNLDALTDDVIDEMHRTHPFVVRGSDRQVCDTFQGVGPSGPFGRRLPPAPADAARLSFEPGGLSRLRSFVTWQAGLARLDPEKTASLVLAVNEIATNSLRHGGGRGELRAWTDGRSLVCEVSDQGYITQPLVGRLLPTLDSGIGAGLWLANQLCDLVQIFSSSTGTAVRIYQDR